MLRTTRKRFRHPMSVTMDYSIFIFTGSVLGLVNPGHELPYNVPDIVYNIVAIGCAPHAPHCAEFDGRATSVGELIQSPLIYQLCTG